MLIQKKIDDYNEKQKKKNEKKKKLEIEQIEKIN